MSTDSVGDMLTIIRNGYAARKAEVTVPHSVLKEQVAKKLFELGYLESSRVEKEGKFKTLELGLIYENGEPKLKHIKRISRPGLRVYRGKGELRPVLSGLGFSLLSTPEGILSGDEARRKGVGGELLCQGW